MKATSNTSDPGRDDAVTRELLRLADRQVIQPPAELLDCVRARLHENTVRSPAVAPARATPWTRSAWLAGAGLAAAVLIALVFWLPPSRVAWSQVVENVRGVPWIHTKAVAGEGQSRETWASFSRNVCATRGGDLIQYEDFRSDVRYEYDSSQKKLYRLSLYEGAAEEFKSVEGLFGTLVRGDTIRAGDSSRFHIVRQRQQTVTEQGRQWIQYELELAQQYVGLEPPVEVPTISIVVRVDPEKMLPQSATITQAKFDLPQPDGKTVTREAVKIEIAFDYPAEGPADIHALGVPRDAPVEDRLPPPELDRIIKIVQQHRRDFGDYLAIAGGNSGRHPDVMHLVRCKGERFRVDEGVGAPRHVASRDEIEKWWREHGKGLLLDGAALGDGRRVYEHSYVRPDPWWQPAMHQPRQGAGRAAAVGLRISGGAHDAADYFVDLLAYSPRLDPQQLASSPLWTTHFDPQGENGPAGSVRVELQLAHTDRPLDRRAYHREEFWLQPEYGYAVVKHVTSDCPEIDEDPSRQDKAIVLEYDDFRQTPSGVWYPTVSRRKDVASSENKGNPAGAESRDEVTCFYLDFAAPLPDELFSTDWRGDLLAGIHFPPVEKAAPGDLGAIQPPGGAPLFPSGLAISVQAASAATQRLAAAPARLDRWVAELQRITGEKLEEWTEKQGCRTSVVDKLSVAFDGFQWNAQAADMLFQRVQTISSAEGKTWMEAFERLLNNKIEQAYLVPLVLLPVDALYQEQKYSPERAKKYLARIGQLTADDLALWRDKVDQWGGTRLDAAMNIILLDDYFVNEMFRRDRFKAAIEARFGRLPSR